MHDILDAAQARLAAAPAPEIIARHVVGWWSQGQKNDTPGLAPGQENDSGYFQGGGIPLALVQQVGAPHTSFFVDGSTY